MGAVTIRVDRSWDGRPLPAAEHARLELQLDAELLRVAVDAPFHGDPPPPAPPGSTEGLWEYEVVELFLLGADQRYLELELGPYGHFLALQLHGPRRRVASALEVDFGCQRNGGRWQGEARIPRPWLPPALCAANAYAIHGSGAERRFAAAHPVPGPAPDFHRLDCFAPLRLEPSPGVEEPGPAGLC